MSGIAGIIRFSGEPVDPQLIEMGRIYGMSDGELFRRVIFPGALPSIFVGIRFALHFRPGHDVSPRGFSAPILLSCRSFKARAKRRACPVT